MSGTLPGIVSRLRASASADGDGLPSWVDGAAIGGSYGRGEQDGGSDLDLFFLIRPHDVPTMSDAVRDLRRWVGLPAMQRGPVLKPHFGHIATLVFEDLSVCQLILNTRESLDVNPMRAGNAVVLDRSGHLGCVRAEAEAMDTDPADVFGEQYRHFWIRVLYAWQSVERGQLWRSAAYLGEIRDVLLQTVRIRDGLYAARVHPHSPSAGFEQQAGRETAVALAFCLPGYDEASLRSCIAASVRWFDEEAVKLGFGSALSDADRSTARRIRALISEDRP